jgi:hypothetical protein
MWFVDDNDERVPVLPNPDGTVRLVLGDADQIALCDLLDGIMELRALGAWKPPTEYDAGWSERLVRPGQGKWGPANWSSIAFSGVDLNQRYYCDDIAYYRRRAEENVRWAASSHRPSTSVEGGDAGEKSAPRSCPHCGGEVGK